MASIGKITFWAVLLVLTVAGAVWAIGYFTGGYTQFLALARPITAAQWLVLGAATAVYYLLDYARLYTLFALLGIRIPLGMGIQLTCVSYFVSNLTPTAELNIPAMIFLLRKCGIPASKTAAVALVKTFYMVLWVCVFGFATLLTQQDVQLPQALADHIVLWTLPALILLALFFYLVFFPERVLRWSSAQLAQGTVAHWRQKLFAGIHNSAKAISELGQSTDTLHFMSHAACILFVLAYVLIGAYLGHVLGLALSPEKALTAFSNSLLVSYLAPVPGSIGVTEVLTSYFLDPAMTDRGMVVSTLLRILCAYVLVIPGMIILGNALREVGWRQLQKQWKADSA